MQRIWKVFRVFGAIKTGREQTFACRHTVHARAWIAGGGILRSVRVKIPNRGPYPSLDLRPGRPGVVDVRRARGTRDRAVELLLLVHTGGGPDN